MKYLLLKNDPSKTMMKMGVLEIANKNLISWIERPGTCVTICKEEDLSQYNIKKTTICVE